MTHPRAKNASYFLIFLEIVTGISKTPGQSYGSRILRGAPALPDAPVSRTHHNNH